MEGNANKIEMIQVEAIEKIVKYALGSGRLEGERPVSLIMVAPPECGKTSIIRRYCLRAGNVFYTTDATAYGIIRDTNQLQDFKNGKLTHVVIPDLLTCLGRKQATVTTFVSFMNALIEEGVVNMSTYATQFKGEAEVKAGLITAIPPSPFRDKRRHWGQIGFISRALPVSFDYQVSTRVAILSHIQKQEYLEETVEKFSIPEKPQKIKLSEELAKQIEPYALSLAAAHSQFQKLYGFRYQKQLQTFAKSIALIEGKEQVDEPCIQELGKLANFINLDFNKL